MKTNRFTMIFIAVVAGLSLTACAPTPPAEPTSSVQAECHQGLVLIVASYTNLTDREVTVTMKVNDTSSTVYLDPGQKTRPKQGAFLLDVVFTFGGSVHYTVVDGGTTESFTVDWPEKDCY